MVPRPCVSRGARLRRQVQACQATMEGTGQRPIQRDPRLADAGLAKSEARPCRVERGGPGVCAQRALRSARRMRCAGDPRRIQTRPPCGGRGGSVSRVLSWSVIPLGWMSPATSCDLPAGSVGSTLAACAVRRPIWSCSLGGLPCPSCCQSGGGLLPHRFTLACDPRIHRRFALCCTFRRVAPPWCYQAQHPVEPGLSSALADSDALIHKGRG